VSVGKQHKNLQWGFSVGKQKELSMLRHLDLKDKENALKSLKLQRGNPCYFFLMINNANGNTDQSLLRCDTF
jgi:hypothetical protein